MRHFHHHPLPDFTTVLSGHTPRDEVGFQSDQLQIFYNNSEVGWRDARLHAHQRSDEIFVVLKGALVVQVEETRHKIRAGEFCCFPSGVFHAIVEVETPIEALMIRAPSVQDKVYK